MNDEELEQAFRDGLRRRADEVLVPPGLVPRSGRSRRRTAALLASVGAVAAVVVVAMGVDAVHLRGHREQGVSDPGRSTQTRVVDTAGWRTEVWRGLQVSVPADWGWGTAPVRGYLCGGPGAVVGADGRERENADRDAPYVGRPIMLSDSCEGGFAGQTPRAPYVWLGADLPAGTVGLGGGYVQQTVEVQGTTLTVATDDASLRQAILDSATAQAGCAPTLDQPATVTGLATEGVGRVRSATLCGYRPGGGGFRLVFATTMDAATAAAYRDGVYDGGRRSGSRFCDAASGFIEVTIVGRVYGTVATQDTVVSPTCGQVQGAPGMVTPVGDALRRVIVATGVLSVFPVGSVGGTAALRG